MVPREPGGPLDLAGSPRGVHGTGPHGILIVKEGLIVAFIVDAFLSQFEDNRALCEDENIASLDQSRAGEGFRIIASKRSSKDDIYRAMFLEDDD